MPIRRYDNRSAAAFTTRAAARGMELGDQPNTEEDQIVVRKCGLKFEPPTLILLYRLGVGGKQRCRYMPLREFSSTTNVSVYIQELLDGRNKKYFSSIPQMQLFSLLERVKLGQKCGNIEKDEAKTSSGMLSSLPPISTSHSSQKPHLKGHNIALMSHAGAVESASQLNESLQFLLNISDASQEESLSSDKKEMPAMKKSLSKESYMQVISPNNLVGMDEEDSEDGPFNFNNLLDLNKVSTEELNQRKSEMDVLFEANQVKPTDPKYEYDKEVDFDLGKVESGWDSDNSHSDF